MQSLIGEDPHARATMQDSLNGRYPTVLLSTEELLAVLELLDATFIPGLDADMTVTLSAREREILVKTASHSLMARGLLRVNDVNQPVLHRQVMSVVGACAYSNGAVLAFHWPPKSGRPLRFFGHFQGETIVAHSRPDAILHRFALLDSKEALIEQLLVACSHTPTAAASGIEMAVPKDVLAQARSLVEAGKIADGMATLIEAGCPPTPARLLAQSFAAAPRVTILQLLKQATGGRATSQTVTLVQDNIYLWQMTTPPEGKESLQVKATSLEGLMSDLMEWYE